MNQRYPKVSIITINYNQASVTMECLKSLQRITYPNYEIIVVDNGSLTEHRIDTKAFPHIRFIQSPINLGFSGGNNLAIKHSFSDYILLLNNDTVVPNNFLEPLVNTMITQPDAGIVSPKIIYFNTDHCIQYAGTSSISPLTCRGKTTGYHEKDTGQYDVEIATPLAHGACMLIKRQVVERIGLLNEAYFLYYEEYDFCERAKKAGYHVYYNGHSHILHKESMSVGKNSSLKSFYMARNRILFALLNFDGIQKYISIIYYLMFALPKNVIKEMLALRFKNSRSMLQGVWAIVANHHQPPNFQV